MLEFFHYGYLTRDGAIADLTSLDASVRLVFNHLDSVPHPGLSVNSLHNGSEGPFAQFDANVVVSIEASCWGAAGCVAVNEACA